MAVSIIILSALVGVGLLLYLHHRYTERASDEAGDAAPAQPVATEDSECCGMHITCERDSLLASVSAEIVYYDDEELDRYAGRGPDSYAEEEVEEFRDVLLTLIPADIAGWGRSLQLRGINLPADVRDELLMIVAEERSKSGE